MAYGIIKIDTITFTDGGIDKSVAISGLVQNPTFSGNITVTGTVSGNTIQGQTVSGATITGGAAAFTTVTGGVATITSGVFALGSASNPSISFTGDANSGLYSPGADQVAISTNGTQRIEIQADGDVNIDGGTVFIDAGSNRLGVNTSSPAYELEVSSTGEADIQIDSGSGQDAALRFAENGANAFAIFHDASASALAVYDNTALSQRLTIDSSGNVGIGTSSPVNLLHVQGDATFEQNAGGQFAIRGSTNTSNRFNFGFDTTSNYAWLQAITAGTSYRPIALNPAGGNVGIGTTSPGATIEVDRGGLARSWTPNAGTYGIFIGGGTSYLSVVGDNGADLLFGSGTSQFLGRVRYENATNAMSLWTNNSERARIDSSGRLLVGTSSALSVNSVTAGVEVHSTTTNNGASISVARFNNDTSGPQIILCKSRNLTVAAGTIVQDGDDLGQLVFNGDDGTDLNAPAARIQAFVDGTPGADDMPGRLVFSVTADGSASPTEAMRINNAGELLVGYTADNGAYKLQVNSQIFATSATIATSDGRYKENVATLDGCVDLVKALRPVSFDWKEQQDITRIDDDGNEVLVREGHNFPDGTQVGFIAQEVEEVLADKPWLGSVIKQNVRPAVTDNDGNELAPEEEFLGIAEGNLVAVLTSALKDAIGRIESLEAEVAALKA